MPYYQTIKDKEIVCVCTLDYIRHFNLYDSYEYLIKYNNNVKMIITLQSTDQLKYCIKEPITYKHNIHIYCS